MEKVFITNILAEDNISSQIFLPPSDELVYNVHIPRRLVNKPIDEPAGGAAVPPIQTGFNNKTENGLNTTKTKGEKGDMEAQNSEAVISYPPYGSYQVTENVIDIPDNRTKAGPIDPYYTIRPELNIANATGAATTTEANKVKQKKNRVSIHIDAEYEREEIKENKIVGFLKGVKACFQNFQKGIIDGFYRFFHRNEDVLADREKY
ncbi:hypothetical protein HW555_012032 [Spodoptera exigua]|uniref:Uncharacterized protein n=1 Tax=Spodoptera exigua TaxID=7107 RepID=A0A835G5T9_SPOEX|nr:hypothetical protein HW555_012032 [Spodoptera exigua]